MIYVASVGPINRETHDPRLEAGLEELDAGEAAPTRTRNAVLACEPHQLVAAVPARSRGHRQLSRTTHPPRALAEHLGLPTSAL